MCVNLINGMNESHLANRHVILAPWDRGKCWPKEEERGRYLGAKGRVVARL